MYLRATSPRHRKRQPERVRVIPHRAPGTRQASSKSVQTICKIDVIRSFGQWPIKTADGSVLRPKVEQSNGLSFVGKGHLHDLDNLGRDQRRLVA
jgi:hypothetical protein